MMRRVRVKMCGMQHWEDVEAAINLGVDALGFIFYPFSKRAAKVQEIASFINKISPFISTTAVFVNPSVDEVQQVLDRLPIQYLQFHGEEVSQFCAQFHLPYIKAIAASSSEVIIEAMHQYQEAQAILLDTPHPERGGTGRAFDWSIIPRELTKPIILAGGLNPEIIQEALKIVNPYAVDVCTGIEDDFIRKDHTKMDLFMKNIDAHNSLKN